MTFNTSWDNIAINGIINPLAADIDMNGNHFTTTAAGIYEFGNAGGPGGTTRLKTPAATGSDTGQTLWIEPGASGPSSGTAITLQIQGSDGTGNSANGGGIILTPGDGGTQGGGSLYLEVGNGTAFNGLVFVRNRKIGSTAAPEMGFQEAQVNGGNWIGIKAPDAVTNTRTLELPDGVGTSGQALTTNGATPIAALSWSTIVQNPMTANLDLVSFDIVTANDSGNDITIQPGERTTGSSAGMNSLIRGGFIGSGATTATAGAVTIQGGTNSRNSGTAFGGAAQVQGGAATGTLLTGGLGGAASITGGNGRTVGGNVQIRPGRDTGDDSVPGVINIYGAILSNTEARVRMFEANLPGGTGNNYTELRAETTMASNAAWTIPAAQQTSGMMMGIDLGEFTIANLPAAATYPNCWALATDASGGRTAVRSDGTNWKVIALEGATVA